MKALVDVAGVEVVGADEAPDPDRRVEASGRGEGQDPVAAQLAGCAEVGPAVNPVRGNGAVVPVPRDGDDLPAVDRLDLRLATGLDPDPLALDRLDPFRKA